MQTLVYFLIWGAFIFFMMRFGCGAHVMGHGRHHGGGRSDNLPLAGGAHWAPPGTAVDPVCGMNVEPAKSKSTVHDGHVYYFCSQDCREKFEASPKAFSAGNAIPLQNIEHSDEHRH